MFINIHSNAFIHALRGFFFAARPGRYHPSAVRAELGLDPDQWRELSKTHLYPAHSLGRLALSSANTSLIEGVVTKTGTDKKIRASMFEKLPIIPVVVGGSRDDD